MELNQKEQQHGPFHKIQSSFNEIYGRPEKPTGDVKKLQDENVAANYKKAE